MESYTSLFIHRVEVLLEYLHYCKDKTKEKQAYE